MEGKSLRLATTLEDLPPASTPQIAVEVRRHRSLVGLIAAAWRADYVVVPFETRTVLALALLSIVGPFYRARLVTVDIFLGETGGWRRFLRPAITLLLRRVYLFLVHIRDASGYQRAYGLKPAQFRYVPYKVNACELIRKTVPTDEGYVFCGGKSRRDFSTLFQAAAACPFQLKVLTVSNDELRIHGSFLDDAQAPPNVEIIRHDGSIGRFVSMMAAARLVVVPIQKDALMQAGIAVYLMAMALGKCVVISAGPGVDDVLTGGEAVIVPPGDADALRAALCRVYGDAGFRCGFAKRGFAYAAALGGTERLRQAIVDAVCEGALRRPAAYSCAGAESGRAR